MRRKKFRDKWQLTVVGSGTSKSGRTSWVFDDKKEAEDQRDAHK